MLLGHFVADYPGQTDRVYARKVAGWPGLLLHGGIVLVVTAGAVFPNTLRLAPYLLGMAAVHTLQDFAKLQSEKWLKVPPLIPYFLDQILHVVLIVALSPVMLRVVGTPAPAVRWTAAVGTALVALTWAYYITWRVALGFDDAYPTEWRWTGKLERTLALGAGLVHLVWLAPLAIIPRLLVARSRGVSITGERYLLLDAVLGIVLSAATGFVLVRFVSF